MSSTENTDPKVEEPKVEDPKVEEPKVEEAKPAEKTEVWKQSTPRMAQRRAPARDPTPLRLRSRERKSATCRRASERSAEGGSHPLTYTPLRRKIGFHR